ncbi:circularly permuted type 2 ATP-grasp protein [Roseibaca sp. Y0-43]|uniref:circularly permuted type 2 ATP-grasp protein n=1 Tax=Roseibaca sp. Y0-43 TaxID=2816854 RepID=UPI001D0C1DDB|nr:circularly permuted type 2 ATP-grasp protein [Roseibaca sp. Y0-43]MCC1481048.1 circularly permuted type 2 ATP-grasp protein [Roseibaca sp. Y0-43]
MSGQAKSLPPTPLLADYKLRSGVADELFDASGAMRPAWTAFMAQLAKLSPEEVAERFARGDRYLRDAGVFFRQYSADPLQEREWPLSHIPVILHERDWDAICAGLTQRAELLERVVADLYGDCTLVRDGHLPAALVAQNPEWHRPLVGMKPASGHFLHLIAFEIGRSPDGSWLVLGDRTQSPSGAGFALENRMATARVFPEPVPRANVRRLAGFFRAFRGALDDLGRNGGRAAILSPGPGNDTYFEHTYVARYLGLPLLEGEDLIVQNGTVQVRTVSGPQDVGVLWRRLDTGYADPLELDETSQIGTPGLVDAVRQGRVNIVNALGSGILETRAFLAFLPQISEVLLGEKLKMPNIATWWCGQDSERSFVQDNAGKMFIGDALSRALPFDIGNADGLAGTAQTLAGDALGTWIEANAANLVGQETVTLSTTPAWIEDRLLPRPMSVRVFAARTAQGWVFLPGGYARVGRTEEAGALSMQQGGSVADVWIMCDRPAPPETLFDNERFRREDTGALPSRAADNLFWLGRYVERAEGAIRLLRGYHLRLAETGDPDDDSVQQISNLLAALFVDVGAPAHATLTPMLGSARLSAGRVRDRFSVDGWAALTDLMTSLDAMSANIQPGDECARQLGILLRKITGFNGLVHENMHRTSGWRFLTLGRAMERADAAAAVLTACMAGDVPGLGLLDMALEYGDSRITHQRRYRVDPTWETVGDLLALDANNPRSVLFQVTAMRRIAQDLPRAQVAGRVSDVLGALLRLETQLVVAHPSDITIACLTDIRAALADISAKLASAYLN